MDDLLEVINFKKAVMKIDIEVCMTLVVECPEHNKSTCGKEVHFDTACMRNLAIHSGLRELPSAIHVHDVRLIEQAFLQLICLLHLSLQSQGSEHKAFQHASKLFNSVRIEAVFMEWIHMTRIRKGTEALMKKDMIEFFQNYHFVPYTDRRKRLDWKNIYSWPSVLNIVLWRNESAFCPCNSVQPKQGKVKKSWSSGGRKHSIFLPAALFCMVKELSMKRYVLGPRRNCANSNADNTALDTSARNEAQTRAQWTQNGVFFDGVHRYIKLWANNTCRHSNFQRRVCENGHHQDLVNLFSCAHTHTHTHMHEFHTCSQLHNKKTKQNKHQQITK